MLGSLNAIPQSMQFVCIESKSNWYLIHFSNHISIQQSRCSQSRCSGGCGPVFLFSSIVKNPLNGLWPDCLVLTHALRQLIPVATTIHEITERSPRLSNRLGPTEIFPPKNKKQTRQTHSQDAETHKSTTQPDAIQGSTDIQSAHSWIYSSNETSPTFMP